MKKILREKILISYINEKIKYHRLAEFIVKLIKDDPFSPKDNFHTVIFRIKDEFRLIDKIDRINNKNSPKEYLISEKNYQAIVGDILGVRIICLRLSDIAKIEAYLQLLSEDETLVFVDGPKKEQSFILPINPSESITDNINLRYTGYSSIHYKIKLGKYSNASTELKNLVFELQLRTILEEAWGEIDHKYRYVNSRAGENIPDYIQNGFYNLSAYLQVAALQAENLCSSAEEHRAKGVIKAHDYSITGINGVDQNLLSSEINKNIIKLLGFEVRQKTLVYIHKRLLEFDSEQKPHKILQKLLIENRLLEFSNIYQEIFRIPPFENIKERDIDTINALNYGIFFKLQGKRVAKEGLRTVLKWRKDR